MTLQLDLTRATALQPDVMAADDLAGDNPLLAFAGPVAGSHALLVSGNGPDLSILIRSGCLAATSLKLGEKADAGCYDLVLVPHLTSTEGLAQLISQTKRALVPTGRVAVCICGQPVCDIANRLAHLLEANGFTAIRTSVISGRTLMRAEQPWFGATFANNSSIVNARHA